VEKNHDGGSAPNLSTKRSSSSPGFWLPVEPTLSDGNALTATKIAWTSLYNLSQMARGVNTDAEKHRENMTGHISDQHRYLKNNKHQDQPAMKWWPFVCSNFQYTDIY
jgi:hypothetical protein